MKARTAVLAVVAGAALGPPAAGADVWSGRGPLRVGEEVWRRFETAHPYAGTGGGRLRLLERHEIHHPGAAYIAPHFNRFELAEGDYVVVRSPDGSRVWRYERFGKGDRGRGAGFWGIHVAGDTAVVELYGGPAGGVYGFTIDRFARGFTSAELGLGEAPHPEVICGTDDTQNAICYQAGEPAVYERSRAVARLLINGTGLCTGWLLGSAGHLMTNEHCIGDASDAANTDYELMAEGATCGTSCPMLACPGTVVATSATLVQVDPPRDYALVLLPVNVSATYGYLQMRASGAVVDERIYVPQHPAGMGKRIAVASTEPSDQSGYAEVFSLSEPACPVGGPLDVGYFADTTGGSSGSPVIGYSDHLVVALHQCAPQSGHCFGANPNRGVPIPEIITDFGGALPPCAVCTPPAAPASLTATPGIDRVELSWPASAGATGYDVYRVLGGCGGPYAPLASGVTATSYTDTAVLPGTTYSYVVRALDGSGGCLGCWSPESPCATATVGTLPPALSFHTLTPCRLVDTRSPDRPLGGPALAAGVERAFPASGSCGIPSAAKAISVNLTVTQPAAAGNLRLFPTGTPLPQASALNFSAAQTRGNNAIVGLGASGEMTARSTATTHFVLDVNGYFE